MTRFEDSLMLLVRTMLKAVLLHVSALNQCDGALPQHTWRYVADRHDSEIKTALLSSAEARVREAARTFSAASPDARRQCLQIVQLVLPTLPDRYILHDDIPSTIDRIEFV